MLKIMQFGATLTVVAFVLAGMSSGASAGTKRVDFTGGKADLIDVLSAYNVDSCHSLMTDVSVKTQPENGKLSVESVVVTAEKGACKGRKIKVFAIFYHPKRGFKGKAQGTVTYRSPPRRYLESQSTQRRTNKYIVTVK